MPQPFKTHTRYTLDLTKQLQFGPLPAGDFQCCLKDGRITGQLAKALLPVLFTNPTRAKNTGRDANQFVDAQQRLYECRMVTKRGVKLLPSNQIGQGRVFDPQRYAERRASLFATILIEITGAPVFYITGIELGNLELPRALTLRSCERVLRSQSHHSITLSQLLV